MGDAFTFSVLWTIAVAGIVGLPLTLAIAYSVVRSREPEGERRARELYRRLLEEEVYGERCLDCRAPVEPDWLRCPACAAELRARCDGCGETLKLHWSACPWCARELARVERLAGAENAAVEVVDADLAHPQRPLEPLAEQLGAAAA